MATDKRKHYCEILGVSEWPTEAELKKAYRALSKKFHPYLNKETVAGNRFILVNEAYDYLLPRVGEKPPVPVPPRAPTPTPSPTPPPRPPPAAPRAKPAETVPRPEPLKRSVPSKKFYRSKWMIAGAIAVLNVIGLLTLPEFKIFASKTEVQKAEVAPPKSPLAEPPETLIPSAPTPERAVPVFADTNIPGFYRPPALYWLQFAIEGSPNVRIKCSKANGSVPGQVCFSKGDICLLDEDAKHQRFLVLICQVK